MKISNFKFQIALVGLLILCYFAIFSYLVHKDLLASFDFDTTVRVQNFIPRGFDTLFSSFSLLGSFEVTTLILLVLVGITRKIKSIGVLFLYIMALVIEVAGKLIVNHPSPPFMFFRNDIDFSFPSSYVQTGFSFPSGHATRTAFIVVIILFLIWRFKKATKETKLLISFVTLLMVLIMFVSRVYLGEHWTTDVIGGFLLGSGFSVLSLIFL